MKIVKYNSYKESKKAIVTRAKDGYDLAQITHPILMDYAKRCQADFIVINEEKMNLGHFSYEIFQLYQIFDTYERVIVIDSDTIIAPDCPNLFDVVPYDCIGTIYEDKFSRKKDRKNRIRLVQEKFGDIGWREGYINSGVLVCSKIHKELFSYPKEEVWLGTGFDDVFLGYRIKKYKLKVFELPYTFNHMSLFSEVGKNWLKSYIIHYAGRGFSSSRSRSEQIQRDWHILNTYHPFSLHFRRIPERLRLIAIGLYSLFPLR